MYPQKELRSIQYVPLLQANADQWKVTSNNFSLMEYKDDCRIDYTDTLDRPCQDEVVNPKDTELTDLMCRVIDPTRQFWEESTIRQVKSSLNLYWRLWFDKSCLCCLLRNHTIRPDKVCPLCPCLPLAHLQHGVLWREVGAPLAGRVERQLEEDGQGALLEDVQHNLALSGRQPALGGRQPLVQNVADVCGLKGEHFEEVGILSLIYGLI